MMKPLKNARGVAMLMALMTMTILGILAAQLVYEAEVYHRIVYNSVDQYKAKLMAKSGLKLALLQLHASKKAKEKVKGMMGEGTSTSLTDQIWQTPLILPPPVPKGISEAEKKVLEEFNKELGMTDSRISVSISGEGHKINLNQLVWVTKEVAGAAAGGSSGGAKGGTTVGADLSPEKLKEVKESIRANFIQVVDQLLQNKKFDDDDFRNRYAILTGETLVQNLIAWMDPETKMDGDNRTKEDYYARVEPDPYHLKNAPMSSLSELAMVKGFEEDILRIFEDNFTVVPNNGININEASIDLLRAMIPGFTKDDGEKLQTRRTDPTQGGKFGSADDFWKFLDTIGDFKQARQTLEQKGIQFTTESTAYRVAITGSAGLASKTWYAYVGDLPPSSSEKKPNDPTQTPEQIAKDAEKAKGKNSSEVPTVLYLKAE